MALDFELLKKHPYATGGVVIVGGLVVFYLLSRNSASSVSGVNSSGSVLAADSALGQAQAAAAIQTNAQNAAIQQAQINAQSTNLQTSAAESVTNNQTIAGLIAALSGNKTSIAVTQSNNDAATLQQMNAEVSQQNIYALQEQGLQDQINQAAQENANNNATSLAGLVDQLNAQGQIATKVIDSSTALATQSQKNYSDIATYIASQAGKPYNTANDANRATTLFSQILAGGNPSPVIANQYVQGQQNIATTGAIASSVSSLSNAASSIARGFFG